MLKNFSSTTATTTTTTTTNYCTVYGILAQTLKKNRMKLARLQSQKQKLSKLTQTPLSQTIPFATHTMQRPRGHYVCFMYG